MTQSSSHSLTFIAAESAPTQQLPAPQALAQPAPLPKLKKAPGQFALGSSSSSSQSYHRTIRRGWLDDNAIGSDDSSYWEDVPEDKGSTILQINNNESAISDDDSLDWNDSPEDDKFFQRVESNGNLASRPSLLTLMLAQNKRALALANDGSQSPSAIITRSRTGSSALASDSDEGPPMIKRMRHLANDVPRSAAQPITALTTHIHHQAAFSPRTTRRHMLATELTESLRRHLLWEREQKTSTANAVLKRRHTSQNVSNLRQFPDKPCLKQEEDTNASSWDHYLNRDELNGYHSRGW